MVIIWPWNLAVYQALALPAEDTVQLPLEAVLVFLGGLFLGALGMFYWYKNAKRGAAADAVRMIEDAKKEIEKIRNRH